MKKILAVVVIIFFFALVWDETASARSGGGRSSGRGSSMGSRGSKTYTPPKPASPSPSQSQMQKQQAPAQPAVTPQAKPASPFGGFMRGLAGGLLGGFIGSLLFSSLGFGSGLAGGGSGGIGVIEILLLALGGFLVYKYVKSRKKENAENSYRQYNSSDNYRASSAVAVEEQHQPSDDISAGLSHIRQFDPSFDITRFKDKAMDIFFKVQAAWMNRDIDAVNHLMAPEIFDIMRGDIAKMKADGRINRLENIAVRGIEITEVWQESGMDYITAEMNANLLDYTTDESGRVVEGSKSDPIRFTEYWTFVRSIGGQEWRLTAIQQSE